MALPYTLGVNTNLFDVRQHLLRKLMISRPFTHILQWLCEISLRLIHGQKHVHDPRHRICKCHCSDQHRNHRKHPLRHCNGSNVTVSNRRHGGQCPIHSRCVHRSIIRILIFLTISLRNGQETTSNQMSHHHDRNQKLGDFDQIDVDSKEHLQRQCNASDLQQSENPQSPEYLGDPQYFGCSQWIGSVLTNLGSTKCPNQ